jgi:hypothetical protein
MPEVEWRVVKLMKGGDLGCGIMDSLELDNGLQARHLLGIQVSKSHGIDLVISRQSPAMSRWVAVISSFLEPSLHILSRISIEESLTYLLAHTQFHHFDPTLNDRWFVTLQISLHRKVRPRELRVPC